MRLPRLSLAIVDGAWVAALDNVDQMYTFQGATLDVQAQSVELLAQSMQMGEGAVEIALAQGEVLVLEGDAQEAAAEAIQFLFATTDQIWLDGAAVYGAIGEDVLLDSLEEAGELLLAALA